MWCAAVLLLCGAAAEASAGGHAEVEASPTLTDASFREPKESFASVDGWNAASFAPPFAFKSEATVMLQQPVAAPAKAPASSPSASLVVPPVPAKPPAAAPMAPVVHPTAPVALVAHADDPSAAPAPAPTAAATSPIALQPQGPTELEVSLIESSKVLLERHIKRLEALSEQAQKDAVEYVATEASVLSHDRRVELDAINVNMDFRLQQVAKQLETERSASAFAGAKASAAAAAAVKVRVDAEQAGLQSKADALFQEAQTILDQDSQLVAFMDSKLEEAKQKTRAWPVASAKNALKLADDVEQTLTPMAKQAGSTAELGGVLNALAMKVLAIIDEANVRAASAAAMSLKAVELAAQTNLKLQNIATMAQQTHVMVQAAADIIVAKPSPV